MVSLRPEPSVPATQFTSTTNHTGFGHMVLGTWDCAAAKQRPDAANAAGRALNGHTRQCDTTGGDLARLSFPLLATARNWLECRQKLFWGNEMPFVKRGEDGRISAIYREISAGAEEYLPPSHAEIVDFVRDTTDIDRPSMLQSDLEMIRVYEDLTDLLIGKNIVMLTDFPPAAQEKLIRRKRLRSSLSPITELLDGSGDDDQELL
jgi:hypothetical protein